MRPGSQRELPVGPSSGLFPLFCPSINLQILSHQGAATKACEEEQACLWNPLWKRWRWWGRQWWRSPWWSWRSLQPWRRRRWEQQPSLHWQQTVLQQAVLQRGWWWIRVRQVGIRGEEVVLGREAVVFQKRGQFNRRRTGRSDGSANLNQYKEKTRKTMQ